MSSLAGLNRVENHLVGPLLVKNVSLFEAVHILHAFDLLGIVEQAVNERIAFVWIKGVTHVCCPLSECFQDVKELLIVLRVRKGVPHFLPCLVKGNVHVKD